MLAVLKLDNILQFRRISEKKSRALPIIKVVRCGVAKKVAAAALRIYG